MKGNLKRGIVILGVVVIMLSTFFACKALRGRAADVTSEGELVQQRDINLSIGSDGDLQIKRNEIGNEPMGKEDSWTLFMYMCGSDLEFPSGYVSRLVKQMLEANASANVNIIIQTGGTHRWKGTIPGLETGRFQVKNNKLELIERLPNIDMGDKETLEDFLTWGIDNYAAEHMGLILWNHGGGSVNGICFDEVNGGSLKLSEIEKAMSDISKKMTDKFDFVGLDACLMSSIEMANILSPYSEYMVASEETSPGPGWNYKEIINKMVENPDIDPLELGKTIVDSYYDPIYETDKGETKVTLSLLDLNKVDDVMINFNRVAKDMDESVTSTTNITKYTKAAYYAENFGGNNPTTGYTSMIDLGDFARKMSSYVSGTDDLIKSIENMVVYMKKGPVHPNATGVSFYYPFLFDGMKDMNILRNIAISPYYMNYLDKILYSSKYSSFKNFSSNEWENSEYYFDKDFEFLDHMINYVNDYELKYRNDSYFGKASFDDKWFDWSSKNTKIRKVRASYNIREYLEVIGDKILKSKVSEDTLEDLVTANYQLAVENGEYVNILGSIGEADKDVEFDGKWFTLSDGQYLEAELITENNSLSLYTTEVLVDGEKAYINFVADSNKNVFVLGMWNGIDENGKVDRDLREIESGTKITPLYTSLNTKTGEIETAEGNETSVSGDIIVSKDVENCSYIIRTVDAFGYITYSDPITNVK